MIVIQFPIYGTASFSACHASFGKCPAGFSCQTSMFARATITLHLFAACIRARVCQRSAWSAMSSQPLSTSQSMRCRPDKKPRAPDCQMSRADKCPPASKGPPRRVPIEITLWRPALGTAGVHRGDHSRHAQEWDLDTWTFDCNFSAYASSDDMNFGRR